MDFFFCQLKLKGRDLKGKEGIKSGQGIKRGKR